MFAAAKLLNDDADEAMPCEGEVSVTGTATGPNDVHCEALSNITD